MRSVSILCGLMLSVASCNSQPSEAKANSGFAVVELFTSEGCSSCPSADALMPVLQKSYPQGLYVLSFHVDYWDYLGWKDAFSDAANTRRQNLYATSIRSSSVYTPQAIVNGATAMVGSDKSKLTTTIDHALSIPAKTTITLSASVTGSDVKVSYNTTLAAGDVLNIALVQQHASTVVKRGENGGRTLQHANVVRVFKTVSEGNGNTTLQLPAGLSAKECAIIVYTQSKSDMHVHAAAEATL